MERVRVNGTELVIWAVPSQERLWLGFLDSVRTPELENFSVAENLPVELIY
jgi:hypothetical protein